VVESPVSGSAFAGMVAECILKAAQLKLEGRNDDRSTARRG
jgi:hypothetical protein